jgi:ribosomal protein L24
MKLDHATIVTGNLEGASGVVIELVTNQQSVIP